MKKILFGLLFVITSISAMEYGDRIAISNDGRFILVRSSNGTLTLLEVPKDNRSFHFSNDGNFLTISDPERGQTIRWDLQKGVKIITVTEEETEDDFNNTKD